MIEVEPIHSLSAVASWISLFSFHHQCLVVVVVVWWTGERGERREERRSRRLESKSSCVA